MYSINFSATKKNFCLTLHCNGDKSYLLVNSIEIVANPLCLGNISKIFLKAI